MNTKCSYLIALLVLLLAMSGLAEEQLSEGRTNVEWQAHFYPEIGLMIQLPHWKADIFDNKWSWSLWAFPYKIDAFDNSWYRVSITVSKFSEDQYSRMIRDYTTNSIDCSDQEQSQPSPNGKTYWIYTRRDIGSLGGLSYICTATIKRIKNMKPEEPENLGGSDERLAAEVQRVLDCIEIVSTNSTNAP